MSDLVQFKKYINNTLWSKNIRVSSIRLINTPLDDNIKKQVITHRLFSEKIPSGVEINNMYVLANILDSNKAELVCYPKEGTFIDINVSMGYKPFYLRTPDISWHAEHIHYGRYGNMSFSGLFTTPNRGDLFTASMRNNKPVIIQCHDKMQFLYGDNSGNFCGEDSLNIPEEKEAELINDLRKLKADDININKAEEIMSHWSGGLVLIGDFSNLIDQFNLYYHIAIIGNLPHDPDNPFVKQMLEDMFFISHIYITDEDFYNMVKSLYKGKAINALKLVK